MGSANILTDKQEKFVQGLMKGLSQREAYKQAYNASRMKETTIDSKASELFKNDKVKARYDEIHGKVIDQAEEGTIADATEIMQFFTSLMRGNESDELVMIDPRNGVVREEQRVDTKTRLSAAKELAKRYGLDKEVRSIEEENQNRIDGIEFVWEEE